MQKAKALLRKETTKMDEKNTSYDLPEVSIPLTECAEAPEIVPPQKREYSGVDGIFALLAVLLGFLFVKLILASSGFGLGSAVFSLLCFITAGLYLKFKGVKLGLYSGTELVLGLICSVNFVIFDNEFIKFLNLVFAAILCLHLCYTANNKDREKERLPYELGVSVFKMPFSGFGDCFSSINCNASKSGAGKNSKYIIIGLLIAVPFTGIAAALLISADEQFSTMMNNIMDGFLSDTFITILQIALGLPAACYIFGMLYANVERKQPQTLSTAWRLQVIPSLVVFSAVIPLCILYLLFFISQAEYFLSAFRNILPVEFSYAEYARRGFFELLAVSLLNFGVISAMRTFCRRPENKKPTALKFFIILLSVFTLMLIATALSKMVMYINNYGLSLLRVYTSWFMILLAFIFIMTILREIFPKVRFYSVLSVVFCVMFMVLSWCDVDSIIASYNVSAYQSGKLSEMDVNMFYELSASAKPYAEKLLSDPDPKIRQKALDYVTSMKFSVSLSSPDES